MDGATMRTLHRRMLVCRRFEEAAARAYMDGHVRGFLHLGIGQEAVAVGALAAAAPTDWVVATYREHAHYLARTGDPRGAMAELFGKATGCVGGRGGSMHLFDAAQRFLGGWAIVGGHVPIAAGVAFASKYRGEPDVTLCFFGEGSANQGAFFEGLALASTWQLPVVFVCENNRYAMGTPLYRTLAVDDVAVRARGFPIDAEIVDGGDVLAVHEAVGRAVMRARTTSQPFFLEAKTYRFRGHSMADPAKYRTKEEVAEWMERDPIRQLAVRLEAGGHASTDDLARVDAEVKAEVREAVAFAESSPQPDPATLMEHLDGD